MGVAEVGSRRLFGISRRRLGMMSFLASTSKPSVCSGVLITPERI